MASPAPSLGPAELCELGSRHARAGNFEQAAAAYYQCLKQEPGSAVAALGLAGASRGLGKLDIAVKVLETAQRFNPQDGRILGTLGVAYLEAGAPQRAIETLERLLAGDSRNFDAAFNLGNACRRLGDKTRALVFYRQALEIRPSDGDAQSSAGDMLLALGRIPEAARHYEAAHGLGDPDALYSLGVALLYGDEPQAARSAFERAAGRDDSFNSLASSVLLAVLAYIEGDEERCQQILDRASALLVMPETGPRAGDIRNMKVYYEYLRLLLSSLSAARVRTGSDSSRRLHIVGDSHVLCLSGATASLEGAPWQTQVHWILGCKQFHLGRDGDNQYKSKFAAIAARIPENAPVLLSLGEIDCR